MTEKGILIFPVIILMCFARELARTAFADNSTKLEPHKTDSKVTGTHIMYTVMIALVSMIDYVTPAETQVSLTRWSLNWKTLE